MNSFETPKAEITCKRMVPLLGTLVRIELRSSRLASEELRILAQRAFDRIAEIERKMSYFNPTSDVARFNRSSVGDVTEITEETATVLRCAEDLRLATAGLFNVVSGQGLTQESAFELIRSDFGAPLLIKKCECEIDLGGIAKGYAVDEAYSVILGHPEHNVIFGSINAGGDLFLFESEEKAIPIQIGVGEYRSYRSFNFKIGALATSSVRPEVNYRKRNGEHLLDSATATVFAPRTLHADALTKLVLLSETKDERQALEPILKCYSAEAYHAI